MCNIDDYIVYLINFFKFKYLLILIWSIFLFLNLKMKRNKSTGHYAIDTRQKLGERHKETNEVKDVLTGHGFKQVKPKYTSRPDIKGAEISHQVLAHDFDKLVDHKRTYGKKQNLRHLDPDMSVVLGWGEYDPPVKNDFTTSKSAF